MMIRFARQQLQLPRFRGRTGRGADRNCFVVQDLGALPGGAFSQPGGINGAGVVAGLATASDGN